MSPGERGQLFPELMLSQITSKIVCVKITIAFYSHLAFK